jgi:hypothetical protein
MTLPEIFHLYMKNTGKLCLNLFDKIYEHLKTQKFSYYDDDTKISRCKNTFPDIIY